MALALTVLMVAATALPQGDAALELTISPGGSIGGARVVGQPESTLLSCVQDAVHRWEGRAFAGARRDTTLLIPLGLGSEELPRAKPPAKHSRLALPWGFVQDLAACRGFELLRDLPADCAAELQASQAMPPCSPPLEADVSLTVRSDGSVRSAKISAHAPPGPGLAGTECLERAARRWRFPEFAGTAYRVGARVLIAPGTPCSDPPAPEVQAPAEFPPRAGWRVLLLVLAVLALAGVAGAAAVMRRRRR